MSLKHFHLFFIFVSVLICLGFGVWGIRGYMSHSIGLEILLLSVGSILLGVGLTFYDIAVYRKFKAMGV